MGTRADFYAQSGATLQQADWLGSIAWDGYPEHPGWVSDEKLLLVATADDFRAGVGRIAEKCDSFTAPGEGWPWPWEDSCTTDFAYVFVGDKVMIYCFGAPFNPGDEEGNDRAEKVDIFPDMSGIANVQMGGKKSGLMVVSVTPHGFSVT